MQGAMPYPSMGGYQQGFQPSVIINNNYFAGTSGANTMQPSYAQGDISQQSGMPMNYAYTPQQQQSFYQPYPQQGNSQMGSQQIGSQMMQCLSMMMTMMMSLLQVVMNQSQSGQQPPNGGCVQPPVGGTTPGTPPTGQPDQTGKAPKVDFKNNTSIQNGMKQLVGTGAAASKLFADLQKAGSESPQGQKLLAQLTAQMTKDGKSDNQIKAFSLLYNFAQQNSVTGNLNKVLANLDKNSAEYKQTKARVDAIAASQKSLITQYQKLQ